MAGHGGAAGGEFLQISEESRKSLRQNLCYLISHVKPYECLPRLLARDVISQSQYDKIVQLSSRENQVEAILDLLKRGSQELYHSFLEVLAETGQSAVVDRIQRADKYSAEEIGQLIDKSKKFLPQLIENLRFEGSLLVHLESTGVITPSEKEKLKVIPTRRERAENLLSVIHKGGNQERNKNFLEALGKTDQSHLVCLLQDGDDSFLVPEEKRAYLRHSKPELIQYVTKCSQGSMLSSLVLKDIITPSQSEVIVSKLSPEDLAEELLDILVCRPYRSGYEHFLETWKAGQTLPVESKRQSKIHLTLEEEQQFNTYTDDLREGYNTALKGWTHKFKTDFGIEGEMDFFYIRLSMGYVTRSDPAELDKHIRRRAEDVADKGNVSIDQVFDPVGISTAPSRVLLLGGAGTGKSTVTQQMTYAWSTKSKTASKAQAIFRFECRQLNNLTDVSLTDLLFTNHEPGHLNKEEKECVFECLKKCQSDIQIIFDGLDELSTWGASSCDKITEPWKQAQIEQIVYSVIHKHLLPKAKVLITSRPIGTVNEDDFDRCIMALGFSKKSIRECMLTLCGGDHSKCNKIMKYIKEHSMLYYHCVVPLNCVFLGQMLRDYMFPREDDSERTIDIDSITRLNCLVVWHNVEKKYPNEKNDIYQMSDENKETIRKLAELAAYGMLKEDIKVIFLENDFKELPFDPYGENFGLLEVTCKEKGICLRKYHTASFLHLSIQEFLAAVHIALTWNSDEVARLTKTGRQRLDMVQMFLCGLLGDPEGRKFLQVFEPELSSKACRKRAKKLLSNIYRSKREMENNVEMTEDIWKSEKTAMNIENEDKEVEIDTENFPESGENANVHSVDNGGVEVRGDSNDSRHTQGALDNLSSENENSEDDTDIEDCSADEDTGIGYTDPNIINPISLKLARLQVIRCVAEAKLSKKLVRCMGKMFQRNHHEKIPTLDLSKFPGGLLPHHLAAVGYFLRAGTAQFLRLEHCKITRWGMEVLVDSLGLTGLKTVKLRYYEHLPPDDKGEYLVMVNENTGRTKLEGLWLGDESNELFIIEILRPLLAKNGGLEELDLEDCKVTGHTLKNLFNDIRSISKLRKLNLFNNPLGDDAHEWLSQLREMNPALEVQGLLADTTASGYEEFESRFEFHQQTEFPSPEPFVITTKTYPSRKPKISADRRRLPPPPPRYDDLETGATLFVQ